MSATNNAGHGSELANVASHMRVRFLPEGGMVLTNPDGTTYTLAPVHQPMPKDFGADDGTGQAALLQWQIDNPWMARQIMVDEQPFGEPGQEPPLHFASRGGHIVLADEMNGPATAPVAVPAVKPATTAGGEWHVNLDALPSTGGALFVTSGVGAGGSITLEFPGGSLGRSQYLTKINAVAKPGTTETTRHVVASVNGKSRFDEDTGVSIELTFGPGGMIPLAANESMKVVITAPGYDGTFGPCDMDIYLSAAGR